MARWMVTGVPGVGKTTILGHVRRRTELPVVNFGSAMLEHARCSGFKGSRDQMGTHPKAGRWRAQVVGALPRDVVIDGHLVVTDGNGFKDAMPPELKEPGILNHLVVLIAEPWVVLERRRTRSRPGDDVSLDLIGRHQAAIIDQARALDLDRDAIRIMDITDVSSGDAANRLMRLLGENGAV